MAEGRLQPDYSRLAHLNNLRKKESELAGFQPSLALLVDPVHYHIHGRRRIVKNDSVAMFPHLPVDQQHNRVQILPFLCGGHQRVTPLR